MLGVLTAARCLSQWTVPCSSRGITSLIRMPFSLTMITEFQITAWSLASDAWTRGTSRGNHSVAAVRRWAPSGIGIGEEDAAHHKVFVFRYHILMCFEQNLDVGWVHWLGAMGTRDIRTRLCDLDRQVALEANSAGSVLARQQRVHVICLVVLHVAELALL